MNSPSVIVTEPSWFTVAIISSLPSIVLEHRSGIWKAPSSDVPVELLSGAEDSAKELQQLTVVPLPKGERAEQVLSSILEIWGSSRENIDRLQPKADWQSWEGLNWHPGTLARVLECDVSLVNAWLDDLEDIPVKTGAWIETMATVHEMAEREKPAELKGKKFRM